MAYKNPVRLEVQESASSYPQVAFSDDTSEVAQSLLATAASASTNFKVQDAERLARIQQQHKARAVQILQMEVKWTLRLTEGAVSKDVLKQAAQEIGAATFQDITDERHLNNLCGWPLCDRQPQATYDATSSPVFRFSSTGHQVYNVKARNPFCSAQCARLATSFKEALKTRSAEEVLEDSNQAISRGTIQPMVDESLRLPESPSSLPDLKIIEHPLLQTSSIDPEPPDPKGQDFERSSTGSATHTPASSASSRRFILGNQARRRLLQQEKPKQDADHSGSSAPMKSTTGLLASLGNGVKDTDLAEADIAKDDTVDDEYKGIMDLAMQLRKDLSMDRNM